MIDLTQFDKITSHNLKIRKIVDNTGDYEIATYQLFAHYEWGDKIIVGGIENPNDAILFVSATWMITEITELRNRVKELEERIMTASINLGKI
jgi:hypothetical protein